MSDAFFIDDRARRLFGVPLSRREPFAHSEGAWFWAMSALIARRDGNRAAAGSSVCEPDDVVKVLDRLYRQRKIDLAHARILRIYGERGVAPNPRFPSELGDLRLWREAMERLDYPLRMKGIVAGPARATTSGVVVAFPEPAP
jgi:hypothetical protein